MDIETDEEGYFSIFDHTSGAPYFSPGSMDSVTVTVYWQWNTSCYINDTGAAAAEPDTSTEIIGRYLPYYQVAYDEYYGPGGLDDQRKAAAHAVRDYLDEHGSPAGDGTWVHYIDCPLTDEEHNQEYASLDPEDQDNYLLEHGGADDGTGNITWAPTVSSVRQTILPNTMTWLMRSMMLSKPVKLPDGRYDDYDTWLLTL